MDGTKDDYFGSTAVQYDSPRGEASNSFLDRSWAGDLTALFTVEAESCDVCLTDTKITWKSVTGSLIESKKKRKKSKKFTHGIRESANTLLLKDIYAVKIKRRRRPGQGEGEGVCLGLTVFTYEKKDCNQLREKLINFENSSEAVCREWSLRIQRILSGHPHRPKRIKFFLQTYSGTSRQVRRMYRDKVVPMFEKARIKIDTIEVTADKNCIKKEMDRVSLKEYDCFACMGGDGTASRLIDAYLSKVQHDADVEIKHGFQPIRPRVPIGIIPTGTTNQIIRSVQGVEDIVTSILHIIYGNTQPIDVCSSYIKDKFYRWSFNLQYGFGSNILQFTERYTMLGQRKIDAAFLKALTKSKLRPYECDIYYIPSPNCQQSNPKDGVTCRTGCPVCLSTNVHTGNSPRSSIYTDSLQEYDPLAISGTSSTIIDLTKENPWRTTKGTYLNVSLFTVSSMCDYAPQGLSKYTHLADGYMDLVLVRNVERKQFLRYLKRHGNSKNQFDFPFVECYRVKEVQFRPRLHMTWKHKDHGFSEIDYEMTRASSRLATITERSLEIIKNESDIEVITGLSSDDDNDSTTDDSRPNSAATVAFRENNSNDPQLPNRNNEERVHSAPTQNSYRTTFSEREHAKRKKKAQEKEKKVKAREEAKMKSVWNIDSELYTDLDLDIRVHPQFLQIFGQGVHPDSILGENSLGCVPHF